MLEYKIEGMKEIDAVLKQMPEEFARKVGEAAVRKGGNVIRDRAIDYAPRDTGKLAESIYTVKQKVQGFSVAFQVGMKRGAYYAIFTEFGTAKQPAQRWFTRAFEDTKGAAFEKIIDELRKGLLRTSKRLAGKFSKSGLGAKKRRR